MISATETAINQVKSILDKNDETVFRVSIEGSGCAGFKYCFELTEPEPDDILIDEHIVTDVLSAMYLENAILDYVDDIFSKKFVLNNPNTKTTCGCGESFSV